MIVLIGLVGCGDDDGAIPAGPSGSSNLWPMEEGNYWDLVVEVYFNNVLTLRDTSRLEVDTAITFGTDRWFGMTDDDRDGVVFYRPGPDGVHKLLFNREHPAGLAELWLRHPVTAGERWHSQIEDGTFMVVSADTSVTVPCGAVDGCIHYNVEDVDGEIKDICMKPDVGPVVIIRVGVEGSLSIRTEHTLLDYHLE